MNLIWRVYIQNSDWFFLFNIQCSIEGTLMRNAYRHPSVLDLIAYYDNKDNKISKPTKNQAAKTRSGKPAHWFFSIRFENFEFYSLYINHIIFIYFVIWLQSVINKYLWNDMRCYGVFFPPNESMIINSWCHSVHLRTFIEQSIFIINYKNSFLRNNLHIWWKKGLNICEYNNTHINFNVY